MIKLKSQIFDESFTYIEAAERCEALGGDGLMAIPDMKGHETIRYVVRFKLPSSDYFFVGLTRSDENSEWRWTLPNLVNDDSVMNWSLEEMKGPGLYSALDFADINNKDPLRVQT
ncbi:hypothetical protein B9Z55_008104 [Caenorhabditis nigoni]|nr:hypothetical protein B9Z55_008104 [Caenorhabditis nigoni]